MKIYKIKVKDHGWYGCYTEFVVLGNSINDMLENLYNQARCILAKKFKCKDNEIRVFVHYPPSFYYFHVHYVHVDNNVDMSISVNRAIPLGNIIQNIKMKSNYYQLISIEHTVKVGSDLYKALKQ